MSLIYEFWTHFIAALQRPENVQTLTNSEESLAAYKSLLDSSFHSIILQWNATVAQPQHHDYYGYPGYPSRPNNSLETTSISRVTELVKLCLSSGRLIECGKLFDSILKTQMPGRLDTFFVPLVTELYKTFARHGLKPTSQPFNDFLRRLVELYLRNVLGAKPSVMRQPPSTRVGCGCQECNALDQFISSTESEKIFRYVQARRTHLQKRLQNVPSLCTFKTIPQGSPRGLQVTKDPKIVEAYRWKERQAAAAKFLVDLNKDVVKEVMGPRYIDVQSAIEGSQPFVLSATLGAQVAPSEAPSQTLGAVAGQKRKKAKSPPADSDVIDLT